MKCDIITATYNRPNLLQRAIKSVLAQTSPDWEHWIYDDGSDYHIRAVVAKFEDPRIHFIQGPKKTVEERYKRFSPAVARNILLRKSVNELIAYLDDDNYFWPEAIKIAIDYFKKHLNRDAIYGKLTYSDRHTEHLSRQKRKFRMFNNNFLDIGQVIHRRKCLECSYIPDDVGLGPEFAFFQNLMKKHTFFRLDFYLINKWKHQFTIQKLYLKGQKGEKRRE